MVNYIQAVIVTSHVIIIVTDNTTHHFNRVDEIPDYLYSEYYRFMHCLHGYKTNSRTIGNDLNIYERA